MWVWVWVWVCVCVGGVYMHGYRRIHPSPARARCNTYRRSLVSPSLLHIFTTSYFDPKYFELPPPKLHSCILRKPSLSALLAPPALRDQRQMLSVYYNQGHLSCHNNLEVLPAIPCKPPPSGSRLQKAHDAVCRTFCLRT
jgi:hypothetical protein